MVGTAFSTALVYSFVSFAKHVPTTTSDSTKTIRPASFYGLTATAATSDARSGPQVLDVPYMPR